MSEIDYFGNKDYRTIWSCFRNWGTYSKSCEAARMLLKISSRDENFTIANHILQYADVFAGFEGSEKQAWAPVPGLEGILSAISEEVDSIVMCRTDPVKVKRGRLISWLGSACYKPMSSSISVSKKVKEEMLPLILSHEYTHHVEFSSPNAAIFDDLPVLTEGLADAVGIAATKSYAARQNDEKLLAEVEKHILKRVTNAIDLIRTFEMGFGGPYSQKSFKRNIRYIDFYSIGCTAFLVAEARHGQAIYRDIFRAENPLDMLVGLLGGTK
ncbi:MAG: hypothetical protein WC852_03050 [Candidatus Nanoarchaeia archaeon]